jgi:hypothetical protein
MECSLVTGELVRLDGGSGGVRLRCLSGTLWLTRGDGVDYLLAPGTPFDLAPRTEALVEALGTAHLRLEELSVVARRDQSSAYAMVACRNVAI